MSPPSHPSDANPISVCLTYTTTALAKWERIIHVRSEGQDPINGPPRAWAAEAMSARAGALQQDEATELKEVEGLMVQFMRLKALSRDIAENLPPNKGSWAIEAMHTALAEQRGKIIDDVGVWVQALADYMPEQIMAPIAQGTLIPYAHCTCNWENKSTCVEKTRSHLQDILLPRIRQHESSHIGENESSILKKISASASKTLDDMSKIVTVQEDDPQWSRISQVSWHHRFARNFFDDPQLWAHDKEFSEITGESILDQSWKEPCGH